jgi:hypothetical protein
MIKGLHGLFFTPQAEELRAFLRDKLRLPTTDTGGGWLVFDFPEADLGCYPADAAQPALSFYCDDIYRTVEDLKSRGVEFTTGISDEGWGLLTRFRMPGMIEVDLYEPKYVKRARKQNAKSTVAKRQTKSKAKSSQAKGKSKRKTKR